MILRGLTLGIALLAMTQILAVPARAEVDLEKANSCIQEEIGAGQQPTACVDEAHVECISVPEGTPAIASLCFREAQDVWSAGIKGLMEQIRAGAAEDLAVIAGIEVKYDLLAGLLQCDRMEELALAVSNLTEDAILRQKSHCEATASGLVYARLFWRARDLR